MTGIALNKPMIHKEQRRPSEMRMAIYAIVLITGIYLAAMTQIGIPAASGLIGHGLGVIGFVFMLATETLYSLRKRAKGRPWGKMSEWLRFHIFTGIVGPYMVLLHTAWSFEGLAGITVLLTLVVVGSGFVGRYIYTAVPRSADGIVLEERVIRSQLAQAEKDLASYAKLPAGSFALPRGVQSGLMFVLGRFWFDLSDIFRRQMKRRSMDKEQLIAARHIDILVRRRRTLQGQIASLAAARRMLALWHRVHIPIGLALFIVAFTHAGAALYYSTLLK
jgi:hypothetical protein